MSTEHSNDDVAAMQVERKCWTCANRYLDRPSPNPCPTEKYHRVRTHSSVCDEWEPEQLEERPFELVTCPGPWTGDSLNGVLIRRDEPLDIQWPDGTITEHKAITEKRTFIEYVIRGATIKVAIYGIVKARRTVVYARMPMNAKGVNDHV